MDLVRIAARVAQSPDGVPDGGGGEMEAVFMSIQFPEGMDKAEAVERAKALIPCEVGGWQEEQAEAGWMVGNFDCEPGFYDESDGGKYGPDDAGVSVEWEKPFSEEDEEDPGPPSNPGPPWDTLEEKRGEK